MDLIAVTSTWHFPSGMAISALLQQIFPGFLCSSFLFDFPGFVHLMKTFTMMWERDVNSDIDHPEKKPTMENGTLGWVLGAPTTQPTPVHPHFIYRNSWQLSFHGHSSEAPRGTRQNWNIVSIKFPWAALTPTNTYMCHTMPPTILPPPTAQTTQEQIFDFRSIAGSVKQHFCPHASPALPTMCTDGNFPVYFPTSSPLAPGSLIPPHPTFLLCPR